MRRFLNLTRFFKINWFAFLWLNFLSGKIKRGGKGFLVPCWGAQFKISQGASINVAAEFTVNHFETSRRVAGASFVMAKNARIEVSGNFSMLYGADVKIFEGGQLILGSGYTNAGIQIRCSKSIRIGNNVAIAKDVVIMDSDAHEINYEGYEMSKEVCIEDNVWIGTRAMILKGVTIGEGSMVAAGAVVIKDVPPHSLVAGVPAKVIKSNIGFKI